MKLRKKQLPSPLALRIWLYCPSSVAILARKTELPSSYSAGKDLKHVLGWSP